MAFAGEYQLTCRTIRGDLATDHPGTLGTFDKPVEAGGRYVDEHCRTFISVEHIGY